MKLFPWSGFLYELRRALRSIPLIVLTVVIVLAAFGLLASIQATRPGPSTWLGNSGAYYYADGAYQFEFYLYDQYGQPVSGVLVNLTAFPSNFSLSGSHVPLASTSATSTSSGAVRLAFTLPAANYTIQFVESKPGWSSPSGPGGFDVGVSPPPAGAIRLFLNGFTGTVQNAGGFRSYNELLVFYPGPNGTAPPGYQVYWAVPQNQTGLVTPLPESAMHRLGTLTQIHQTFHLVVPVPPTSTGPCTAFQCGPGNLQVELFTSDGQLVATDTNQSAGNFFPPTGLAAGTSITFGFAGIVMVILVPLMAVLAAYSVYGKDRLTGVLEGVLVRPVSRLGLVASRYLAVITALCIAVLAGVITLDALVAWVYGGFLPLAVVGVILGGLLVEVGAFTGITFLLSHVLRTTGGLVGIGLAIFAFFTIGWLVLIPLLGALTGVYFTPGFQTAIVELAFLNPTQFLILGEDLFLGSVQGIFYPGAPGVPIAYGITDGSVIGAALAWVIGPAALLFYVVRRRD